MLEDKRRGYKRRYYKKRGCYRRGYRRREGPMRVIAPGDMRRQVVSGVYTTREEVIREEKETLERLQEKRMNNERIKE